MSLCRLLLLTDVIHYLDTSRHLLFGHICRLPENTPASQALQLSIEAHTSTPPAADWKCPPGRPRRNWLQQVEEDVGLSVGAAWIGWVMFSFALLLPVNWLVRSTGVCTSQLIAGKIISEMTYSVSSGTLNSAIPYIYVAAETPSPPLGHIWDVMLVWRKGNINKNCFCVTVLCTIVMVHKDTSSSYRSVDCIGLWSCLF